MQAHLEQPRIGHGAGVEHHAAGNGHHRENAEYQAHGDPLPADTARRRTLHRHRRLRPHLPGEAQPEQDRHHARQDERRTPAEMRGEEAGEQGGESHAEVAPHAVHADLVATILGVRHQHRGAHRMVDGGEHTDQGQPDHQHRHRVAKSGEDRRRADAKEEHLQHVPAIPLVAQPAGRQRTGAEGDEAAEGQADQLGVTEAEALRHAQHGGREDQHEHVVDDVSGVDVANDGTGSAHGGSLLLCLCPTILGWRLIAYLTEKSSNRTYNRRNGPHPRFARMARSYGTIGVAIPSPQPSPNGRGVCGGTIIGTGVAETGRGEMILDRPERCGL
ncbi:hypothetical protein D3C78_951970 [compost metagenome]